MINFKTTTIIELHKKLVSGEITSADLVQQSKSIIAEKNPDINAIIEVFDDTFIPEKIIGSIPPKPPKVSGPITTTINPPPTNIKIHMRKIKL